MTMRDPGERPSRSVLLLLVLACLTVITLDSRGGSHSPIDPLRMLTGNVIGPVETGTAVAVGPFRELAGFVHTNAGLRRNVARLEAENSQLRTRVETLPLERLRLAELDGLTRTANQTGYSILAAHVVAMGSAQSFSQTVTIDAGTSSGLRTDLTVLNNDGLVGRVVAATRSTATVLLITDPGSVVGGRLGSNLQIGFLRGEGSIGNQARLNLSLVDPAATAARNDVVLSWGSKHGVPYVAGIPIGRVLSVYASPRQLAKRAVIAPYVDFSALDVVGVVVPKGTHGDRPVIAANGGHR